MVNWKCGTPVKNGNYVATIEDPSTGHRLVSTIIYDNEWLINEFNIIAWVEAPEPYEW